MQLGTRLEWGRGRGCINATSGEGVGVKAGVKSRVGEGVGDGPAVAVRDEGRNGAGSGGQGLGLGRVRTLKQDSLKAIGVWDHGEGCWSTAHSVSGPPPLRCPRRPITNSPRRAGSWMGVLSARATPNPQPWPLAH